MSDQYIGEVRLVGFNFAPIGWSLCSGQLVSIAENSALFNLIGTTYGGDGQTIFGLPDLQGRTPLHQGTSTGSTYVPGQVGGLENVTISANLYPTHSHTLLASGNQSGLMSPGNNVLGQVTNAYSNQPPSSAAAMNSAVLGNAAGSSSPHDNLQPFLVLTWVIALDGIFPQQD